MGSVEDTINAIVEDSATRLYEDIPDYVIKKTIDLFVDTIGCVFAGATAEGIDSLKETLFYWGGNPQATVLASGERTSAPSAALINSAMAHARDFDDAHDLAANHGSVVMVPALLSAIEACQYGIFSNNSKQYREVRVSGEEFIAALSIGLEITNRLAMTFASNLHAGWLPTSLWGPFGAAAACGRLLHLDTARMHNAFGLAYSQIHGNRQALIDATLAKRMQPGFSASAGLQSAFLAANGITAAHKIINGDFGIPVLYTNGMLDEKHLTNGLGKFEQTMNISIKPYPSCRCSHAVIDAILDLQKKHDTKWEEIEKGLIYLPPNSMAQIGQPFAVRVNPTVDAQFSAQYTAALTFIKGRPSIADFEAESVRSRQDILQLLRQFTTVEFEKETAEIGIAEIELTMKNESVLHTRINATKGSPSNPLTEEEQVQKFFDCMDNSGRSYSTQEKEKVLELTRNIVCYDDVTEYIRSLQEIAGQAHF